MTSGSKVGRGRAERGVWLPLTTYTGPVINNGNQATITDTNPIPPQEFYRIDISLP